MQNRIGQQVGVQHATANELPDDWYTTAARAEHDLHCTDCRERTAASAAALAENGASMERRDRRQLALNIGSARAVNV